MKKMRLILLIIVAFILVIFALNYKWIYYLFYPFDRITGKYTININNQEIVTEAEYYEYEVTGKSRLENDTENFKIKGGYGQHKIGFVISDNELYRLTNDEKFRNYGDVDLSIIYYCTNSWYISKLDIDLDIVEENNEWYVCCDVGLKQPTEDLNIITFNETTKMKLDEIENCILTIGI